MGDPTFPGKGLSSAGERGNLEKLADCSGSTDALGPPGNIRPGNQAAHSLRKQLSGHWPVSVGQERFELTFRGNRLNFEELNDCMINFRGKSSLNDRVRTPDAYPVGWSPTRTFLSL